MHGIEDEGSFELSFRNTVVSLIVEILQQPRESVKAIDNMGAEWLINMIFGATLAMPSIRLGSFECPSLFKHSRAGISTQVVAQDIVVLHEREPPENSLSFHIQSITSISERNCAHSPGV